METEDGSERKHRPMPRVRDCRVPRQRRESGLCRQKADADEPFWTSKGMVTRTDRDGIGDPEGTAFHGGSAHGYNCPASGESTGRQLHRCAVLTNYTMRFTRMCPNLYGCREGYGSNYILFFDNSAKLEQFGGKGIPSDNLSLGRFKKDSTGNDTAWEEWDANGWITSGVINSANRNDVLGNIRTKNLVSNHDASYNVLFTDGAVKTYGDGSGNILMGWAKTIADCTSASDVYQKYRASDGPQGFCIRSPAGKEHLRGAPRRGLRAGLT